ncbi:glycosyltransferase [Myroides injenensis]|uniref:glycosyltransferase n=1 Tax=Myroides injenensis TaxID=1183151 RepID=UPI0022704228|nr:glycosyltransferase [Myroides injenensis]
MILLDSIYVNNGGGKILLDYLVLEFELRKMDVFYLFDKRCYGSYNHLSSSRTLFVDGKVRKRKEFYKKNGLKFEKVLCFGNLPPLENLDCQVYTYFHQPMYLNVPKEFSIKERLTFKFKQLFLSFFKNNTNFWLVQNSFIKDELCKKYNLDFDKVLLMPFYPNKDLYCLPSRRENNTFIYVSNGTPHKNHLRLFGAFKEFYDIYKKGKLIVTINSEYSLLLEEIEKLRNDGYPIVNIGFVNRKELISNYHKAEYLIFPSLEESFGLGIVEAIECGCKVIGADLPYMYEVCNPSINFNPMSIEDIKFAFVKAINKEEKETTQNIFNEIDKLISILKE